VGETRDNRAVGPTLASLASLVAALSCCLPLGTLLMAAGAAGAALFSERLRPWLLAFSIASLLFAFVQTYVRRWCDFRYRRFRTLLLWFSALLVTGMIAAPRYVSSLLAGRLPSLSAAGQLRPFEQSVFERDFNAASGQMRLVVLLSPT
jgi:hypothetical protein